MLTKLKYKNLTWIDLESPTQEEIKMLITKYSVHPLVADELLRPTVRSRIDTYKNLIYLVIHFPIYNPISHITTTCEIDFILGKNFLITAHYKTITPLHEMIKVFETDAVLRDTDMGKNVAVLFFHILRHMYAFSLKQLDYIQEKIENIEKRIFNKKLSFTFNMVQEISLIKRDILDFRRMLKPHKDILHSFDFMKGSFLSKDLEHYINNMIGDYLRVWNTLEGHKETAESIKNTHDSMLSHRTNDIMKILTIMAFVTFPLSVFTGLFGMGANSTPILGAKGDFWIILGVMALATTGMFAFFKHKKWM